MKFRVRRSSENRAISYHIAVPRCSVLFLVGDLRPGMQKDAGGCSFPAEGASFGKNSLALTLKKHADAAFGSNARE